VRQGCAVHRTDWPALAFVYLYLFKNAFNSSACHAVRDDLSLFNVTFKLHDRSEKERSIVQ
jgi:hypothetical protein